MTNTLNQQPLFASLQLTDVLFLWQGAQSPGTRKMPVSALGSYYASLSGAVFSGPITVVGGVTVASGGMNVTGVSTLQQLIVTSGVTVAAGGVTVGAGGVTITDGGLTVSGTSSVPLRDYLAGMILSNDISTPNTVIDIGGGVATDSTHVSSIVLGAFTKTTTGPWGVGSGGTGMGNGLTIANSTWYHVFAILNAGLADVYFDTSVTAANAPAGTTAFRRIGSFKTDGSAHIVPFTQRGNEFIWGTSVVDVSGDTTLSNSRKLYTLGSVPPGVNSMARVQIGFSNSSAVAFAGVASPDMAALSVATVGNPSAAASGAAQVLVRTNTSQQVAAQGSAAANNTITFNTDGWIDSLGRGII